MSKFYLFILITFLTSCGGSTATSVDNISSVKDSVEIEQNIINEVSEDIQNLALDGSLNGKYPIFMQLDKVGSSIYGEMLYKKTGQPISISGSESDGKWTLSEMGNNDEITGVYEGIFEKKQFKGSWTNPKNEKSMSFELTVSDESIEDYKKEMVSDKGVVIAQKYSNGFSDFTFEKVSDTEYLFSFMGTKGFGESAHIGTLDDIAIFKDGKLYYRGTKEDETENCSFTAIFKGNKMFVKSESSDMDCAFGANVGFGTEYTKE